MSITINPDGSATFDTIEEAVAYAKAISGAQTTTVPTKTETTPKTSKATTKGKCPSWIRYAIGGKALLGSFNNRSGKWEENSFGEGLCVCVSPKDGSKRSDKNAVKDWCHENGATYIGRRAIVDEDGNPIINKKTKKPETAPVWRVYKDQKKAKAAAAQKAERKAAREAAETESKAA